LKKLELEHEREAREIERRAQGLLEFGPRATHLINNGTIIMTKGNVFNVGGNIQARNVVAGDMISSANAAVQNIAIERAEDREVLTAVLKFLEKAQITSDQRETVGRAVALAAEKPSQESKGGVLKALKALGAGAATLATVGGGYAEIIDLVSKWIG
jgi:hypothetical protein